MVVGAAVLALAVLGGAVAFGCGAAVMIAAREVALRARLRRIDNRAARALDVRKL